MRMGLAGILAFAVGCGPSTHETPGSGGADAGGDDGDGDGDGDGEGGGDCQEGVDVVLVLDVSSSMGFVLDELQADIDGVVTATNELAPDAHFGLVAFSDNGAIDTTGDLGMVHTASASLVSAFAEVQEIYTSNDRNPGDGPGGPVFQNPICEENALDALHMAATGFPWREDAARVIIVATDDTFLERPDNYGDGNGSGVIGDEEWFEPPEGDYPAEWTVPETTTALTGAGIRVFSFSALEPISGCGTARRMNDEDVSDGWSTPYGANAPFPDATDGRNYDLAAVEDGTISLGDTIAEVVVESHCNPID